MWSVFSQKLLVKFAVLSEINLFDFITDSWLVETFAFYVLYQTRTTMFHRDSQRELKIRHAAKYS